jgi:hypothetical protein
MPFPYVFIALLIFVYLQQQRPQPQVTEQSGTRAMPDASTTVRFQARHRSCALLPLHDAPAGVVAVVVFQIIDTLEPREEALEGHQQLRIVREASDRERGRGFYVPRTRMSSRPAPRGQVTLAFSGCTSVSCNQRCRFSSRSAVANYYIGCIITKLIFFFGHR